MAKEQIWRIFRLGTKVEILLLLMVFSSQVATKFTCQEGCSCALHSRNVQCVNQHLVEIPMDIPGDTLELTLRKNTFENTDLTRGNFTKLRELERLYLIDCGIQTIAVDTFIDLEHLEWLDLSENRIKYVADYTFRGLDLKHLFINDNYGLQLSRQAFSGLKTQGLYMNNCGLRRLSVDILSPLKDTLRTLWLNGNNFNFFDEKWINVLKGLIHVRLHDNAFHCNCDMKWFISFFTKSRTSIFSGEDSPKCSSPGVLEGKSFDDLQSDDFRCTLPSFQNVDAIFDSKVGKLTCKASGDPAPVLYWIRPDGNRTAYYPRDSDGQQTKAVMFMTDPRLDSKEAYRCVASNPAGNVTFSLNVVWPDIRPKTVPTPKASHTAKVSKNNVIRVDESTQSVYKHYAGDDSGAYDSRKMNMEKVSINHQNQPYENEVRDNKKVFTGEDIVGAVIGTFLLTVLLCVIVFHFYYRRRERMGHSMSRVKKSQSRVSSVCAMSEFEGNRMINHPSHLDSPS